MSSVVLSYLKTVSEKQFNVALARMSHLTDGKPIKLQNECATNAAKKCPPNTEKKTETSGSSYSIPLEISENCREICRSLGGLRSPITNVRYGQPAGPEGAVLHGSKPYPPILAG